jgi:hypothetical protein
MAILTASGRAALAAAIKQQTLHLALGLGEPGWDTDKDLQAQFDENGLLDLGVRPVSQVVVTALEDSCFSSRSLVWCVSSGYCMARWISKRSSLKKILLLTTKPG